ncbi:hypothetical protein [Actinomadura madurae]|uniref:hypothetical protein n=1 Tax=Actinomadura madurae TaxID=1993 RepID=UPI0027E377F2|nr:hypothetical protein [Actinomadura madurae]
MTVTTETARPGRAPSLKGRWIDDWRPEDPEFWAAAAPGPPAATSSSRSSPSTSASRCGRCGR